MSTSRILSSRIYKDTHTISLMDEFEKRDDDKKQKYDMLFLRDVFCIKYNRHLYWVGLYIQKKPKDLACIDSGLTFTELKKHLLEHVFTTGNKNSFKITKEAFKAIAKIPHFRSITQADYFFELPIEFNAQNSSNRCGYGNRYHGEELIHEGTLYGDTTDYMFVGVQYRRW